MQYEFSFDFKPTKFVGGWTNILHLTTGGNTGRGSRIPALFMTKNYVSISNTIGSNGNWNYKIAKLIENEWVHFRTTQTFEQNEYVFRLYMNELLMTTEVNNSPQVFKRVHVWVSNSWYAAAHGYIKNIYFKGNNKFNFSLKK